MELIYLLCTSYVQNGKLREVQGSKVSAFDLNTRVISFIAIYLIDLAGLALKS